MCTVLGVPFYLGPKGHDSWHCENPVPGFMVPAVKPKSDSHAVLGEVYTLTPQVCGMNILPPPPHTFCGARRADSRFPGTHGMSETDPVRMSDAALGLRLGVGRSSATPPPKAPKPSSGDSDDIGAASWHKLPTDNG